MLLLTGATGKVGGHLAKLLSAEKVPARALVRDPGRATTLSGLGVELVQGDLDHPDSLTAAFRGVDKAFLVLAAGPNLVAQTRSFIAAARSAGVRQIVKISSFLPALDSPNPVAKRHAESNRELERSGVPYTILRANFFMQNLLMFRAAIKKHGTVITPCGEALAAMIDVRDLAGVAAAALTGTGHAGKTCAVTGDQAISFHHVAGCVSNVLGRPIKYKSVSPEEWRRHLIAEGFPEANAAALSVVYQSVGSGDFAPVTTVVRDMVGKPAITFAQFTDDHATQFRT